jgi:hypothetical protein
MLKTFAVVCASTWLLGACAHHGAAQVHCTGALRPINPPATTDPVTVIAPSPDPTTDAEKQP